MTGLTLGVRGWRKVGAASSSTTGCCQPCLEQGLRGMGALAEGSEADVQHLQVSRQLAVANNRGRDRVGSSASGPPPPHSPPARTAPGSRCRAAGRRRRTRQPRRPARDEGARGQCRHRCAPASSAGRGATRAAPDNALRRCETSAFSVDMVIAESPYRRVEGGLIHSPSGWTASNARISVWRRLSSSRTPSSRASAVPSRVRQQAGLPGLEISGEQSGLRRARHRGLDQPRQHASRGQPDRVACGPRSSRGPPPRAARRSSGRALAPPHQTQLCTIGS